MTDLIHLAPNEPGVPALTASTNPLFDRAQLDGAHVIEWRDAVSQKQFWHDWFNATARLASQNRNA